MLIINLCKKDIASIIIYSINKLEGGGRAVMEDQRGQVRHGPSKIFYIEFLIKKY